MELIIQEVDVISEILSLMNYRKNKKVIKLAYGAIANMMCIDEMRKMLLKQTSRPDVLSKLVSVIGSARKENTLVEPEEVICALQALTNAL